LFCGKFIAYRLRGVPKYFGNITQGGGLSTLKYLALTLGFFFISHFLKAQLSGINLVPDSSFENTPDISNMNPCNGSPDTFNNRSNIWKNPTDGTPEIFSQKYLKQGWRKLPHIVKFQQLHCNQRLTYTNPAFDYIIDAKHGYNCAVLGYSHSYFNGVLSLSNFEYIQSPVNLVAGRKYVMGTSVFFWTVSGYEYPSIDFKLTTESMHNIFGLRQFLKPRYTQFATNIEPTVSIPYQRFSSPDSTAWVRVGVKFRVDSAYKFLTIGYFGNDSVKRQLFDSSQHENAIIALDDVFIYEIPGIVAPSYTCKGAAVQISSTLAGVHTWYKNGQMLSTTDSFFTWVADSTSTFVARGYYGSDTMTITVHPSASINPIQDTAFCQGKTVAIMPSANMSGNFSINGVQKPLPLMINTTGQYKVGFTNNFGCKDSTSFNATVYDLPEPLTNAIEWCKLFYPNDSILLDNKYHYLFDSMVVKNFYHLKNYGNIGYQVTNKNNCTIDGSISITNNCENKIFIPNAFRPSGINKTFTPFVGVEGNHTLTIYTRWGEKIHESTVINPSWDGICGYETCIGGWYLFILKLSNGETLNGAVYLLDGDDRN